MIANPIHNGRIFYNHNSQHTEKVGQQSERNGKSALKEYFILETSSGAPERTRKSEQSHITVRVIYSLVASNLGLARGSICAINPTFHVLTFLNPHNGRIWLKHTCKGIKVSFLRSFVPNDSKKSHKKIFLRKRNWQQFCQLLRRGTR